jgi:PAS domain S-box-containing protein
LVDNLDDVVVVLDRDMRIVFTTPGIERLIDAPAYTNVGENALNDIHPDDYPRVVASLERLKGRPRASERVDFRLHHSRHGWRWVEAITVNLLDDPDVNGLVVTVRDVHDRRLADEQLRDDFLRQREAADRLRDVDRLKDEFLATVSHELRTPLTSIAGMTEMLLTADGRFSEEETRYLLERIDANAGDMTAMIERILDYSRLQAGQVALRIEVLDLASLVTGLVDRMGETLERHLVEVHVAPLPVRADSHAVSNVLRNLLQNAVKYSPPVTRIEVGARPEGDKVVVWVRDEGIGIAPEEQSKIFRHFYQAGDRHRGVGIGLNIARQYAQLNHGRLWVESALGAGSTFFFSLPAAGGSDADE